MTSTQPLPLKWGELIRKTRTDQGLSLESLAGRAEIDLTHLSKVERGLAGFGDDARIRLARALGCQVADLFPYPRTADQEPDQCPSAAAASDAAPSRTRATRAATRSPAPNAEAPAASAPEESHGTVERSA